MSNIKLGILPPPGAHLVDPAWLRSAAQAVESAGCESFWLGEHPFSAETYQPLYPYSESGRIPFARIPLPDPIEALTFVAAVTEKLRIGTAITILPLHPAPIMAKRAATLDRLSGGRLMLGVGAGWMIEEYVACRIPYSERGARLDEAIVAMRRLWSNSPASFSGQFNTFERMFSDPQPQLGNVPIIVGGSSKAAAMRAGKLGDGYFPLSISPEEFAIRVEQVKECARDAGRDPATIELTAWPGTCCPERAYDWAFVQAYVDAGARRLILGAFEWTDTSIDAVKHEIDRYQDQVLGRISCHAKVN